VNALSLDEQSFEKERQHGRSASRNSDRREVFEALKECYDPEIPVNLVDLGLIYDVKIIDDWVGVKMTLTTPGCGMSGMISQNVRNRVLKVPV